MLELPPAVPRASLGKMSVPPKGKGDRAVISLKGL